MVNNKTLVSEYVQRRLQEWAEWFSRGNFYGLGYPSCSIEYRLMREGSITKHSGSRPLPCNTEAEEIEKLVKELSEQNNNLAIALRCFYFTNGSLRVKAKNVAISHVYLKYYVDMAHQWLMGRLSAK